MKRAGFKFPRFALCEGNEDAALVRALKASTPRNIKDFDVSPNNDLSEGANGSGGFEVAIIAADGLTGFEDVQDVVIISDNDDDPDASFARVRAQLAKAKNENKLRDWGLPDEPYVRAAGSPSVSIWMWPEKDKKGCLETVLWEIASRRYLDQVKCVETALKCSAADAWPTSKLDKARVRCLMSLKIRKSPALALSLLWRDQPQFFPVDSKEFTPFARFLSAMP